MLLNCGVGEDSWDSLGLQGDPTSPSYRRSVLGVHCKDWCWSWNSNTLATWCEELTHLKRPDAGKDWRCKEKGTTEDEMVGWHHWLYGLEFEQVLGAGDGQGSLACSIPGVTKSQTQLSNWTELTELPNLLSWCSFYWTTAMDQELYLVLWIQRLITWWATFKMVPVRGINIQKVVMTQSNTLKRKTCTTERVWEQWFILCGRCWSRKGSHKRWALWGSKPGSGARLLEFRSLLSCLVFWWLWAVSSSIKWVEW